MRRVATLFAFLALLSAAGADAAPQKRYLRLTAYASFNMNLDYGSGPRAVYNGFYEKFMHYQARAIVVFNGTSVSLLPGASMVVQGRVAVIDKRTQWVSEGKRAPVTCNGPGAVAGSPGFFQAATGPNKGQGSFVITKGARVTVSADGLRLDPGTALSTNVGCTATEELENHGLRGGPWFAVSAPQKSRFSGRQPFSLSCADNYSHSFILETDGNGHSFDGFVQGYVSLTPFPSSTLTNVKKALRDSVGKQVDYPSPKEPKDCIQ